MSLGPMIKLGAFTICADCLGPMQFNPVDPYPLAQAQIAPYPVDARWLVWLPLKIFLYLKVSTINCRVEALVKAGISKVDALKLQEHPITPAMIRRACEREPHDYDARLVLISSAQQDHYLQREDVKDGQPLSEVREGQEVPPRAPE